MELPELKIQSQKGRYKKGNNSIYDILNSAINIIIEEGHSALSMRKVAQKSNLSLGAITYYFPTKQELIKNLFENSISGFISVYDEIYNHKLLNAEQKLEAIIRIIIQDIPSRNSTRVVIELWAMSNHDPFIQEIVEKAYKSTRVVIEKLVSDINPKLSSRETRIVALFISSTVDGMTPFAGYEKPWCSQINELQNIAVHCLIDYVRNADKEQINSSSSIHLKSLLA